jgi:hypothetical protein
MPGMGAIRPWHLVVCLGVVGTIVAVVTLVIVVAMMNKRR